MMAPPSASGNLPLCRLDSSNRSSQKSVFPIITITDPALELQVFGGKLNTLDDYKQPLTGAGSLTGFQKTAMLYNPVYARTIPYSTFGAGFACLQNEETVFSAIMYDTNDTPTVSGFDTFFDNGATVYAEWNLSTTCFGRPGHHSISGTYSSGSYTDLTSSAFLDPIAGLVIVAVTPSCQITPDLQVITPFRDRADTALVSA